MTINRGSLVQTLLRTTRFGDVSVDEGRVFAFADGLLGFPTATQFLALDVDDASDIYWLQCVNDGALAFLAISPWAYFPDYTPEIDENDEWSEPCNAPGDPGKDRWVAWALTPLHSPGLTRRRSALPIGSRTNP